MKNKLKNIFSNKQYYSSLLSKKLYLFTAVEAIVGKDIAFFQTFLKV
jgi:hypothetical protein